MAFKFSMAICYCRIPIEFVSGSTTGSFCEATPVEHPEGYPVQQGTAGQACQAWQYEFMANS